MKIDRILFIILVAVITVCFLFCSCNNPAIPPITRGSKWVVFQGPAVPLLSNRINDIVPHRNSQIWIATDSGATYFDNGSWGVIDDSLKYTLYTNSYPPSFVSSKVNCISVGKDGSIWFGLAGGGISRYFQGGGSGRTWIRYRSPQISYNVISSLTCENIVNGDVWATTMAVGVNRFIPSTSDPREGTWKLYTTQEVPDFGTNLIRIAEVNFTNYSVWIASQLSLVAWFGDVSGWRSFDIPAPYNSAVQAISIDENKRVWVGKIEGASMYNLETGMWTHFTHNNTGNVLPSGAVNSVLTVGNSIRYFGTDKGLVVLNDTAWTLLNRQNVPSLPSDTITALSFDRQGNLWIGTKNGVVVYNEAGTLLE